MIGFIGPSLTVYEPVYPPLITTNFDCDHQDYTHQKNEFQNFILGYRSDHVFIGVCSCNLYCFLQNFHLTIIGLNIDLLILEISSISFKLEQEIDIYQASQKCCLNCIG